MSSIKCVIIDDEPMARKGLGGYVEKIDFLQLIGVCEDAMQLNSLLKQQTVDLLFLDIEMPYISGVEFLKSLTNPPKVIFTTAYENYALQGFDLDVLDYLLKPISFDRFLKGANKAHDYFNRNELKQAYFFVKADNRLEKVFFDDILFVESMENYVGIYTKEKKLVTHATLKAIHQSLPSQNFIQTHKSFLVNTQHINAIEGNTLYCHKHQVPISKYMKDEVMQKIVSAHLLRKP